MAFSPASLAQPARTGRATLRLPLIAAVAAVLGFAVLQGLAHAIAGVFEYPLDDVYIHLAMASGLAQGTYGVNPGEPASAASSILYPVLLMPFAGSEVQRMLPLVWNLIGVAACGGLWGAVVAGARLRRGVGLALAGLGPILLNMPGVAFLGMEHTLHTAASLATLLGLWTFLRDGRIAPWFVAALILGPLFRLEGLALSLGAAGAVMLGGRVRAGLGLALATVVPVLAFMGGLMALGLPPLPSSVLVKLAVVAEGTGRFEGIVLKVAANLVRPAGALLGVLVVVTLVAMMVLRGRRTGDPRGRDAALRLLAVTALAGAAHLVEGQVGWLHRYEHYIIVVMIAGLLLASGSVGGVAAGGLARGMQAAAGLLVATAGAVWLPGLLSTYVWNPRAIHLQQAQMGRFAQDFVREPVAVNDLGRVVWGNPDYVLDLWGLASDRARRLRLDAPPPAGWAGILTGERKVRLAMVYDHWIGAGIAPGWVRIGRLSMQNPRAVLGGPEVTFYATDPGAVADLTEKLRAFAATLPPDARMQIGGGGA